MIDMDNEYTLLKKHFKKECHLQDINYEDLLFRLAFSVIGPVDIDHNIEQNLTHVCDELKCCRQFIDTMIWNILGPPTSNQDYMTASMYRLNTNKLIEDYQNHIAKNAIVKLE